ncbi:MAG: CheR family methyltransferase, partial [Gallionella sp.]
PELRNMITFRPFNLLSDSSPGSGLLDAIFCRNVMIYFDKKTQLDILQRFVPLLRPDGLVFAGHSESFFNAAHLFKLRRNTVYELAKAHSHGRDQKSNSTDSMTKPKGKVQNV